MFGEFALEDREGRPISLNLRKAEALLGYLVLAPGQASSRETLAALLWGDSDQARARQSLRQVLFALTKAFAQHELTLLRLESQSVRLVEGALDVDTVAFDRAIDDGTKPALRRASELYCGELLSGFSVDAPEFEEWLSATRGLYRETAMRALGEVLQEQERSGEFDQAIETANRALRIDPFREDIQRQLMRIYAANGMRSSALSQYRSCRDTLQRQLGVLPDQDTTRLYRDILERGSDDSALASAASASMPTVPGGADERSERLVAEWDSLSVGRERELEQLKELLDQAAVSGGRVALISGEAGVGKSHLAHAFVCQTSKGRALVATARGFKASQALPYGLWRDAVTRLLGEPDRLPKDLSEDLKARLHLLDPQGNDEDRRNGAAEIAPGVLYPLVADVLAQLAAVRPIILFFDDLQWSDDESLQLLFLLGRGLSRTHLLILGTMRDDAVRRRPLLRDILTDLRRDRRMTRIRLDPLPREKSIELAWQLQQALGIKRDSKARLNRVWQLSEGNPQVIREVILAGAQAETQGSAGESSLPQALLDEVAMCQGRLSQKAQQLMAVTAVVGQSADYGVIARAVGLQQTAAASALEELAAEGVLTTKDDTIGFVHRRTALAAYQELLPPRRRLLHGAVARAIEEIHGPALEMHFQDLAYHNRQAGEVGKALRFEIEAARVEVNRGLPASARRLYQGVLDAARRLEGDAAAIRCEIDAHLGLAALAEAEEDQARAKACLESAATLAARHGDARQRTLIFMAQARMKYVAGDGDGAYRLARQALDAARLETASGLWLPGEHLIEHLHLIGGGGHRAVDSMLRRRQNCARLGLREDEADAAAVLGLLYAMRGELARARQCCEDAVRIADSIANEAFMAAALQARGVVEAWSGDDQGALASFDRALGIAAARGDVLRLYVLTGHKGIALLAANRAREAESVLEQAIAMARMLNTKAFLPIFKAWLAEAAIGVRKDEEALRLAREALRLAAESNQAWARSVAYRALARILSRPSCRDLSAADRAIRAAVAAQSTLGLNFETARSLVVHAKILRAWGNARRSSEIFAEAGQIFEKMGMTADFDRARTMAEALKPVSSASP